MKFPAQVVYASLPERTMVRECHALMLSQVVLLFVVKYLKIYLRCRIQGAVVSRDSPEPLLLRSFIEDMNDVEVI